MFSSISRIGASTALAAALLGSSTLTVPTPAAAGTVKYLETNCVVKAMVSKRDGCLTWGMPHWVEVGRKSPLLPSQIADSITGCMHDGLYQLVEARSSEDGPIPPQYTKALSSGYFAVGCVEGITQALVKLDKK